ncbi:patatin-like phospholipase family protein [Candidatus Methylocalor cossyra]|uniref:Ferredoxin reductase n=1 Tax=Candidatus Methylocalor cossyra TaxID=3108543 RepID=A0ABM9NMP2_9GAMM
MKPRIAIACQGGGSQTAFTAGVLKAFCENRVQDRFNIVSISGTSGGAICGFLLWYALKKGEKPAWKRLLDFWDDNTARTYRERLFNDYAIHTLKLMGDGFLPHYNLSPSSPLMKFSLRFSTVGIRREFTDLGALLDAHADFQELAAWDRQLEPPILILGACNVLTGRLHKFSSYLEPIKLEHLLASACVPTIFPAVAIGEMAYWDGLFSDNPPISCLTDPDFVGLQNIPNEIWVIKINPTTADEIPVKPSDILDRRNELAGNISLFHGLSHIERINRFLTAGAFTSEFLTKADVKEPIKIPKSFPDTPDAPYHIPRIEMSVELAKSLTYESKLDRRPEHIERLIRDGEMQGKRFLDARLNQMDAPRSA